jgi:L-lysine exporter family protein LysE/ArgO
LILPLGPQNTFVLTQASAVRRLLDATPIALTAALCDTVLITVAVGGVGALVLAVPWFRTVIALGGTLFMLAIAATTWRDSVPRRDPRGRRTATDASPLPAPMDGPHPAPTVRARIRHTLAVSLLNPHAILDTLAVIGGASVAYDSVPLRIAYGVGACLVSWLWFGGLLGAGHAFRRVLHEGSAQALWGSRLSALLMTVLALRLLWTVLRSLRAATG